MKGLGTVRLETNRIVLRKFVMSDAVGMYNNWASDPKACEMLSWNVYENKEQTLATISTWIKEYENPNNFNWVAELKTTHEIIGNISVVKCYKKHNTCEIGYCFGSKYWNNGYASEILKEVVKFLLFDCDFRIIEARRIADNPASGRVMEKASMKLDAVLKNRRINPCNNKINDLYVYSISKEDL